MLPNASPKPGYGAVLPISGIASQFATQL